MIPEMTALTGYDPQIVINDVMQRNMTAIEYFLKNADHTAHKIPFEMSFNNREHLLLWINYQLVMQGKTEQLRWMISQFGPFSDNHISVIFKTAIRNQKFPILTMLCKIHKLDRGDVFLISGEKNIIILNVLKAISILDGKLARHIFVSGRKLRNKIICGWLYTHFKNDVKNPFVVR